MHIESALCYWSLKCVMLSLSGCKWEDNIKIHLKNYAVSLWSGFLDYRIHTVMKCMVKSERFFEFLNLSGALLHAVSQSPPESSSLWHISFKICFSTVLKFSWMPPNGLTQCDQWERYWKKQFYWHLIHHPKTRVRVLRKTTKISARIAGLPEKEAGTLSFRRRLSVACICEINKS